MSFPQENPLPVQQIAVQLREDINEHMPDHIDVSVTTSQTVDGSAITLTVNRWPPEMSMLSHSRIFDDRRAVLAGLTPEGSATLMSSAHHLSDEACLLATQLQSLADRYQVIVGEERNFIVEIVFNRRALDDERNRVLQSMKINSRTSP